MRHLTKNFVHLLCIETQYVAWTGEADLAKPADAWQSYVGQVQLLRGEFHFSFP